MFSVACNLAVRAFGVIESRLSIVLFHRVLAAPDPMLPNEPDTVLFTQQMKWLQRGFNLLPLRQALTRLRSGNLPVGAVCVTFDDGYRDNADHALPILSQLGIPATFFVTTRYLDGGLMWNDRIIEAARYWATTAIDMARYGLEPATFDGGRAAAADQLLARIKYLPYDQREAVATDLFQRSGAQTTQLMMNEDDIRRLHRSGMEIGGHTVSHPILCTIGLEQARTEIAANKSHLEAIIGSSIETFAFPNGRPHQDYDARHVAVVRDCGYRQALTTAAGTATAGTSAWQLPRFTPWDRSQAKYLARMLQNYFRAPVVVSESVDADTR